MERLVCLGRRPADPNFCAQLQSIENFCVGSLVGRLVSGVPIRYMALLYGRYYSINNGRLKPLNKCSPRRLNFCLINVASNQITIKIVIIAQTVLDDINLQHECHKHKCCNPSRDLDAVEMETIQIREATRLAPVSCIPIIDSFAAIQTEQFICNHGSRSCRVCNLQQSV